jgi:hypothetical protein
MDTEITFPTIEAALDALSQRVFGADLKITAPEPEPEYRRLEPHEIVEEGDEYYSPFLEGWCRSCNVGVRCDEDDYPRRRRVAAPKKDPFFSDLEDECAALQRERDMWESMAKQAQRDLNDAEARIASLNGHITFQHVESWAKVSEALGPQQGGMSLVAQTLAAIAERDELRESCDGWERIAEQFGRTIGKIEDVLDEGWSKKEVEP